MLNFKTLFHEARNAIYCGKVKQVFYSDLSVKLAIENFELGFELLSGKSSGKLNGTDLKFNLRPSYERLPEALWYSPIVVEGHVAARIGINLHYDKNTIIASIANIQGKKEEDVKRLKSSIPSGSYWAIEIVKSIIGKLNPKISVIRGVASASSLKKQRRI